MLTFDFYVPRIQGLFNIPVDNLSPEHIVLEYIKGNIAGYKNAVAVSRNADMAKRFSFVSN